MFTEWLHHKKGRKRFSYYVKRKAAYIQHNGSQNRIYSNAYLKVRMPMSLNHLHSVCSYSRFFFFFPVHLKQTDQFAVMSQGKRPGCDQPNIN